MVAPDSKDRSRSAISTAYVSARENTIMDIRTFGKSSITAAYVPSRVNTAYPIPLSTKLTLGRPNPRHHEGGHHLKSKLIKPSVYHHTGVWGSRINAIHKAMLYQSCALIIIHQTLLFNKSLDHCISACHTINPYRTTDFCQYITSELVCLREGR